jgi:hypothetical protein
VLGSPDLRLSRLAQQTFDLLQQPRQLHRLGLELVAALLVEDNEMNRDMLSRRLQKRGHEILIGGVAVSLQRPRAR